MLGGVALGCSSPLKVRKDAAAGDSGAPDVAADAPGAADTLPTPIIMPDAPGRPKDPLAFRFDNLTDRPAYVRAAPAVLGRAAGPMTWQDCFFFDLWCLFSCADLPPGSDCCVQCEQPLPTLLTIPPHGSLRVPWNLSLYRKAAGTCGACECQEQTPVYGGSFEAYAPVFADYTCSPGPCTTESDGRITMANPRGEATMVSTPFTVPYGSDDVVLVIATLPSSDAGAPADGSAMPDAPAADGPASKDALVDGLPGGFADVAGHTFEIAASNTAPDASSLLDWPCRPSDANAVYHLVFSADGSAVRVIRWDPVQEETLQGTLSWASDTELIYALTPSFAGARLTIRRDHGALAAQLAIFGSGVPVVACVDSAMRSVD